ncbi:hypothetical protein DCE79_11740 [Lysinibacillus sp. 2017]|uniref:hypothetical protein n=1 Tax=unclassified Lysinibacillus TaxID=2636778 RepID=UPI000D526B34|nr:MULTISPECIES: hypothetical protein [unclassified Lysinibacillus]AWE08017.1 hypothetical protein DCE79_11740 [Lysinibacillus sp. 2017]TGN34884.1 hypothetical protein E4L99_12700 [Lysinibacillus sp. S2017]
MKSSMRAFGIGLFLAGASLALYDQFAPNSEKKDIKEYEQQIEEYETKIAKLEKQLEQPTNEQQKSPTASVSKDKEIMSNTSTEKNDTEDVLSATIYIYENVTLYSIGQQVEDEGIIANGRELELFLSKPEYARSIQKGAFDLRSDMTIEQIAKVITGKKIEE